MKRVFALYFVTVAMVLAGTRPSVEIRVDTGGQVDGSRCYQFVTDVANVFLDPSDALPDNWAIDRWENTIREYAAWFMMSSNDSTQQLWRVDENGDYVFVPDPRTVPRLQETLRSGMKPRIVMATSNIPGPMIEGGFAAGEYGFNVRQPNDYEAWQKYIESCIRFLVDEFGRDEVRQWCFTFGVEADWQARFIDPKTEIRLGIKANRREFMKVFDYFHAALVNVLGPSVYAGIYCANVGAAPDYLEHWATGTNYATGKIGTRAGFIGFSDWYKIDEWPNTSPYGHLQDGKSTRRRTIEKYQYVSTAVDQHPELRDIEINIPEHGFFDTTGGIRSDGTRGPIDYLPADYRGSTLFAIRAIAYAETPRINWVNARWMLGPDTFTENPDEEVRPPRFNALRISRDMAEQRLLPVQNPEPITPAGNEVRAVATAADDSSGLYRILLVNFNHDPEGGTPETARLELDNLPLQNGNLEATVYRIDENHNNWWKLWREYRKTADIAYRHSDGVTHLGQMLEIGEKYLDNHLYVKVTTDEDGYRQWLDKLPEYREIDGLYPTEQKTAAVSDGQAVIDVNMMPNSTLYLELQVPAGAQLETRALDNETWILTDGIQRIENGLSFKPEADRELRAERKLSGLEPGATYAWILNAESPVRMVDLEAAITPGLDAAESKVWISYDGVPQRLVLSGKTDANGTLSLILRAPSQPWKSKDELIIKTGILKKISSGARLNSSPDCF